MPASRGLSASFFLLVSCLLALSFWTQPAEARQAEPADPADDNPYGSGISATILLTNSGFGLGGNYRYALSSGVSMLVELSIGAGKDEREVAFFDRFGRRDIPHKANYLLMVPVQIGLEKRVFRNDIEDNFRPYWQFSAGPTLGWEYPYFQDCNGDGSYNRSADCNGDGEIASGEGERTYDAIGALIKGSFRFGIGGTLALGAHFGRSQKLTQGVRIGYTFTYFLKDGIQLLEPSIQEAQHGFGTPTISVFFGRLF